MKLHELFAVKMPGSPPAITAPSSVLSCFRNSLFRFYDVEENENKVTVSTYLILLELNHVTAGMVKPTYPT